MTNSVDLRKPSHITVENAHLQSLQWRFAFTAILIPFLGTIAAFTSINFWGVGLIEVSLFISFYALTFIGTTVGFHRYFAHKGFETNSVLRIILAILGSMAAQGPLINWAATHRRHHQYSDAAEDPHSPYIHEGKKLGWWHGLWHSHIGWMLNSKMTNSTKFARDLIQDVTITRINKMYLTWVALGLIMPAIIDGFITWSWIGVIKGFLWGGLVRLFFAHQFHWTIGSITHIAGQTPFITHDESRNNVWLAIPTFGEAWHNNHHAFPNSAMFGLEWWQIDLGGWVVRFLESLGLIWHLKVPTQQIKEAKKRVLAVE